MGRRQLKAYVINLTSLILELNCPLPEAFSCLMSLEWEWLESLEWWHLHISFCGPEYGNCWCLFCGEWGKPFVPVRLSVLPLPITSWSRNRSSKINNSILTVKIIEFMSHRLCDAFFIFIWGNPGPKLLRVYRPCLQSHSREESWRLRPALCLSHPTPYSKTPSLHFLAQTQRSILFHFLPFLLPTCHFQKGWKVYRKADKT